MFRGVYDFAKVDTFFKQLAARNIGSVERPQEAFIFYRPEKKSPKCWR